MKVRVVLYGGLQRQMGAKEQSLELAGDSLTVREIADALVARHPGLRSDLEAVVFAVGNEIVDAGHRVLDGDEVGFLPPVSGG